MSTPTPLDGYEYIKLLGSGGFGKVFLARSCADGFVVKNYWTRSSKVLEGALLPSKL